VLNPEYANPGKCLVWNTSVLNTLTVALNKDNVLDGFRKHSDSIALPEELATNMDTNVTATAHAWSGQLKKYAEGTEFAKPNLNAGGPIKLKKFASKLDFVEAHLHAKRDAIDSLMEPTYVVMLEPENA
jgi:hypothetical protein